MHPQVRFVCEAIATEQLDIADAMLLWQHCLLDRQQGTVTPDTSLCCNSCQTLRSIKNASLFCGVVHGEIKFVVVIEAARAPVSGWLPVL
jgi:hypothetical protein